MPMFEIGICKNCKATFAVMPYFFDEHYSFQIINELNTLKCCDNPNVSWLIDKHMKRIGLKEL